MKWMRERMPRGLRIHVRRYKAIAREQMEVEEFRRDKALAMAVVAKIYFSGEIEPRFFEAISKWWDVRREYLETRDESGFTDARRNFGQEFMNYDNTDPRLRAAIGFISGNFTETPGRGR